AEIHNNCGIALHALRRDGEAIAHYEAAIALRPDFVEAHANRGVSLQAVGQPVEAIVCYERALTLRPDHPGALNNLGIALQSLGHAEEAKACFQRILAVHPEDTEARYNLGVALHVLDRPEEAVACYAAVIASRPDFAEAHHNLGAAFRALNRPAEALAAYAAALALAPDYAEAHWNDGLMRLATGDFETGWRKYEWRWRTERLGLTERHLPRRRWSGAEDLSGKTILLHAEQGLGDTLQFVRYAPLLAQRGARVVLEVLAPLQSLLAALPGISVLRQGAQLPAFDYHCPLLSLPLACGTTLASLAAETPYLAPPADRIALWRPRIESGPAPRIGIVWAGHPTHENDRNRSIPFALLRPLLGDTESAGPRFFALQKEPRESDKATLSAVPGLTLLGDRLADFADTAAAISLLDLVITVDTAVAHLAGALGKAVWILLPFAADWRWMLGRADSPWYPSARLFRQKAIGDWDSVVGDVRDALSRFPG
ncbi:MAG: glycosyltransferase family protein, partial [Alphaproteobacteria bacterium]|nr:glycosyltransferase family protein [Alphaproteobacteria bacterium]